MAKIDEKYHNLLYEIKNKGFRYEDPNRKGVFRLQIPNYQIVHSMDDGFPAITTKKLYWKGVVAELLWFLRGNTDIRHLWHHGVYIWDKDWLNFLKSDEIIDNTKIKDLREAPIGKYKGEWFSLGRIYGAQWRDFGSTRASFGRENGIDQISNLIKGLKEKPMGTQHIVTVWNPVELYDMALPPCHWSFEILVEPLYPECEDSDHWDRDGGCLCSELSSADCMGNHDKAYGFTLKWHQRSVDTFLGLPFNIASYALLAHIIGKITNMVPKAIIGDLSNVHIYEDHMKAVDKQLLNDVYKYGKCELVCNSNIKYHYDKGKSLDDTLNDLEILDFELHGYNSYDSISAEMLARDK